MAASPLQVWQELEQVEKLTEKLNNVSQGDTIELARGNLIKEAFPSTGRAVELSRADDESVSDTDYEIDIDTGTITWNNTDTVSLEIEYKTAPVNNSVCQEAIDAAKEEIEERTGTIFGRTETVTERYDRERPDKQIKLWSRPVKNIEKVEDYDNSIGEESSKRELEEGRDKDYFRFDLGIEFTAPHAIAAGRQALEITYDYGYDDMPEDIEQTQKALAMKRLMENRIVAEVLEGRDDYNPGVAQSFINDIGATIDRYKISRINEMPPTQV